MAGSDLTPLWTSPWPPRVAGGLLVLALVPWMRLQAQGGLGPEAVVAAEGDGASVVLSLHDVYAIEDGSYELAQGTRRYRVLGPTEDRHLGECVTVGALWDAAEGAFRESWVEPHPGRRAKGAWGLVGLVLVGGLAGLGFRRGPSGWVPRA